MPSIPTERGAVVHGLFWRTWGRCLLLVLLLCAASLSVAQEGSFKTLLMPGKLSQAHAKFEPNCEKCHEPFSKRGQSRLCLDCHDAVGTDLQDGEGLHGRAGRPAGAPCIDCHGEHNGRDAQIALLDSDRFDHGEADFHLDGSHLQLSCTACHSDGKRYREAPSQCGDCHRDDDPHAGHLGTECQDCHQTSAWSKATFDHDKTGFPLMNAHRNAECQSCHPQARYKVGRACVACHAIDDVHGGSRGTQCQDCHVDSQWDRVRFDHDRQTRFPLLGRHSGARCEACHQTSDFKRTSGSECQDCHQADDAHQARFGSNCKSCHDSRAWSHSLFDHRRDTKFVLEGAHADLGCIACHRGNLHDEVLASECVACHAADDVHRGQQGARCDRCHNSSGWGEGVVFDHDLTAFPLLGMHAVASCESCHIDRAYKGVERNCRSCHAAQDIHKRSLGDACQGCHNPNDWTLWRFDHDAQTTFVLDGKHAGLACVSCHDRPAKGRVKQSAQCGSCHRAEDIHNGGFGRDCGRCHVTTTFKDLDKMSGRKR